MLQILNSFLLEKLLLVSVFHKGRGKNYSVNSVESIFPNITQIFAVVGSVCVSTGFPKHAITHNDELESGTCFRRS